MAPPFKMFCDPLFKNMLVAMIPNSNGQPIVNNPPILTIDHLKKYIEAELDLMKNNINNELSDLMALSKG